MDTRGFVRGQCYFTLSFLDEELQLPQVESFVYLGIDLLPEHRSGDATTWYFKSAERFTVTGYRLDPEDLTDCIRVGSDTIDLVLDRRALAEQLLDNSSNS